MHYFGYIDTSLRNGAIYRQGTITMKQLFNTTPDWAWYDGPDSTTSNVRAYWMEPTLGGGSLLNDLQTLTDPAIKTPLMDLLDLNKARTFGFWAAEKIQYTRHSPSYFVDVLLLAGNEDDVVALELLRAADAYGKCCWHDD